MQPSDTAISTASRAQAERIESYRRGELTEAEFRPIRVSYGLYYELDHCSYLQRIKLPGGLMTAVQADEIAAIADKYARGRIHVTVRQNVQLHWVPLASVAEIYERLDAVGITTRGAAGDAVRTVTGCPHAGLWPRELFDVTPYVYAVQDHFLFHPFNLNLPRKFKIAFSGCLDDCVQARVNDIAYFPRTRDGALGFSVYAAGGLGAQPFLAQPIRAFIPADDALIMAEALIGLWHRRGERKNRKRARMKHLFQRLGTERFIAGVNELYAEVEAECGSTLRTKLRERVTGFKTQQPTHPPSPLPVASDPTYAHWVRTNVFEQKQPGHYCATVELPLGEITGAQLRGIAGLARNFGAGELRATPDQNVMIPWISGSHLRAVYCHLCDLGLAEPDALRITDVISCPGGDFCSLAVTRSMRVAAALRAHWLSRTDDVEELGPLRIKISGCPNACGQHHVADIGLTGLSVKGNQGERLPHYGILLGGRGGEGTAALAQRLSGRVPEDDVPKVLAALAEYYRRERRPREAFGDFVQRVGVGRLGQLARRTATTMR